MNKIKDYLLLMKPSLSIMVVFSSVISFLLAPGALEVRGRARRLRGLWAPTTLYLVILRRTGALDVHVAASSYLGVLLVGAAYLSTGLLTSAMTKSQLIALVLSALVILVLFLLGIGELVAREGTTMHAVCNHVSVWAAMIDFSSGIVDTRRLFFYGTLTVVPLYFTVRVVDAWRWG